MRACFKNGHLIECIEDTEKGWIGYGLNLETGQPFIQTREEDGVYTTNPLPQ